MKIIKTKRNCIFLLLSITVITIALTSCKTQKYNNFTTYFNTFYNAERLMKECESEFEFQSEKKRVTPKILVPMPQNEELKRIDGAAPAFLAGLKVDRASRQAVNTKLDSIIIKGSKILAKSPRSNYVVPSLYLMAKTYFYKEEWMPSQIKCSEVIDKDPEGKFSADAHLLMAMNLLMQGKYDAGLTMLSRTVDVAWLNGRYDILTKAFHIEAEMALYYGDLEGAVRPYFQAIAQSDDRQAQALWQNEMAAILFRMGRFDRAEKAFAKVSLFKPDLVTRYEADLYRASSLIRLGQIEEANRILYRLDNDGKFEEWKDYVMTQRLVQSLLHGTSEQTKMMEFQIDSLYPTSEAKAAYFFEKGVKDFEEGNYVDARSAIAKARNSRTPFIGQPATKLFRFFNEREIYVKNILNCFESVEKIRNPNNMSRNENSFNENNFNENSEENSNSGENNSGEKVFVEVNQTPSVVIQQVPIDEQIDRLLGEAAKNYFELARLYFNIGNIDTANYYYKAAADIAPLSMESSARYLYVYSESIRDTNAWKADSILHEIVNSQPKTEFGQAAMAKLGYTAAFVTDSVLTLYNSGYELMRFKEYNLARVQFKRVFTEHPENLILAPKSLYALGYMFEHNLKNFDSAKYYYSILIEKYPNSVYAQELALPVKYKTLVDNNSPIPDSLKSRNVDIYEFDIDEIINAPYDSTLISKPPQKGGSIMDDLKNPSKLLERAKRNMQEQMNKITDIDHEAEYEKFLTSPKKTDQQVPAPEDLKPEESEENKKEDLLFPE